MNKKLILNIVATGLALIVSFIGLKSSYQQLRTVDLLLIYFGGFGAGVSFVNLIRAIKEKMKVG